MRRACQWTTVIAMAIITLGCNSRRSDSPASQRTKAPVEMNEHEVSLTISAELEARLREEAARLGTSREDRVRELLDYGIAPAPNLEPGFIPNNLEELRLFMTQIPGVRVISTSEPDEAKWWIKFDIDINSNTAWHVVQNLAYVLNELSLTERLPTTFKPTSPPPYLNGGPDEFLSWVIEAEIPLFDPSVATGYLKQRLPNPVTEENAWLTQ